jgi:hypothetical protein
MAAHIWSVLCMFVLTDSQTNSVSYINALETIAAPVFPALLPPAAIGTMWQRNSDEEETLTVRLKLLGPGGAERTLLHSTSFTMRTPRHRFNISLQPINLDEPGRYQFIVEYEDANRWRPASHLPLDAVLLPVTPQTQVVQ